MDTPLTQEILNMMAAYTCQPERLLQEDKKLARDLSKMPTSGTAVDGYGDLVEDEMEQGRR